MQREVWVWVQHRLGEPNPIAAEAMTAGEILAARADARLCCVAVGWGGREVSRGGVARGAEVVYVVDDPILRNNLDDRRLTASLVHLVRTRKPLAILFDGSITGQRVGARVAAALGVAVVGAATALTYRDGAVIQQCPLFGSSIMTEVTSHEGTAVVILQPGVWAPRRPERGRSGELIVLDPPRNLPPVGVVIDDVVVEEPPPIYSSPRLVVVTGTRNPELTREAQDLAQALGGRWMDVDEYSLAWTPRGDRVGPDTPMLYLALGVAGAFRRRAGYTGKVTVVAVHPYPDAPIFRTATYGIVADPQTVLRALMNQLERVTR